MTTYIIDQALDEFRSLSIYASEDRTLIFIHRNGATISLSAGGAQQLCNGLMAVLSGHFDHAVTETYLLTEAATEAARLSRIASSRSESVSTPATQPELDSL